jgi:hypothetical protein
VHFRVAVDLRFERVELHRNCCEVRPLFEDLARLTKHLSAPWISTHLQEIVRRSAVERPHG